MNSEEALERIKKSHYIAMICMGIDKPDIETEKAIKTIEKDLEILEILKKHIYIMSEVKAGDTIISQSLGMSLDSRVNDNDFIKVKEWLEND